jgi:2'-5' RNA ligase
MAQIIYTDGANAKSINPWDLDANPEAWTWLSNAPQNELDNMFYKVAASFRAVNKRAIAAANVPFQVLRGEEVLDDSTNWTNAVKFLPKPKDLIKRVSLSLTFKNAAYLLQGKDVLHQVKGLHFLVPTTISPVVKADTGEVDYYERSINGRIERIAADDKKLVKIWLLDHTTEMLPSKNTSVQSIFNSVGSIYFADLFVRNFYERGGVKPTVLALKGAIFNEKKEDIERGWSRFLRNLSRFSSKIFNAETMDVKPIGAGVDDLKNNEVYRQAIENIALGVGMPTSHLLSDWDSYATATVDYMMWQRDDIFPLCEAIAEDLNLQVFTPQGLRFVFQTEMSDAETQDEVDRAKAYEIYVGAGIKPSVAAQMVGIELPDGVDYDELDKMAEENEKKEAEKQQADRDQQLAMQEAKKPAAGNPAVPAKSIKGNDTTAMIALRIPDSIRAEIKKRYSFVDKETLDNLHITLVYLGDNRTINLLDVIRAASELGMYQAPIKGTLQGLARFRNGQDVDPLVMTFDSPQAPGLYNMLCGLLDNYHVPYHKDHGFIPHMTLAYIPADGDMPIDAIEPIEINFSEIHLVNGNAWFPVGLVGYENKTKSAAWIPTLDEYKELDVWREVALRRFKKGDGLDFEYQPHYGGLPDALTFSIRTALLSAGSADEIKAAFEIEYQAETTTPAPVYQSSEIVMLAEALNNFAKAETQNALLIEALKAISRPAAERKDDMQITINNPASVEMASKETIEAVKTMTEHFVSLKEAITLTPAPLAPIIQNVINVPDQPAPMVTVTNEVNPTPVTIANNTTVQPAKVIIQKEKEKQVKLKIERNRDGAITGAKGEIE